MKITWSTVTPMYQFITIMSRPVNFIHSWSKVTIGLLDAKKPINSSFHLSGCGRVRLQERWATDDHLEDGWKAMSCTCNQRKQAQWIIIDKISQILYFILYQTTHLEFIIYLYIFNQLEFSEILQSLNTANYQI